MLFNTGFSFLEALLQDLLVFLETLMSLCEKNELLGTSIFWSGTMSTDDNSLLGCLIFRRSFFTVWRGTSKNFCPGRLESGFSLAGPLNPMASWKPLAWLNTEKDIIAFYSPTSMDNLHGRGSNLRLSSCCRICWLNKASAGNKLGNNETALSFCGINCLGTSDGFKRRRIRNSSGR